MKSGYSMKSNQIGTQNTCQKRTKATACVTTATVNGRSQEVLYGQVPGFGGPRFLRVTSGKVGEKSGSVERA